MLPPGHAPGDAADMPGAAGVSEKENGPEAEQAVPNQAGPAPILLPDGGAMSDAVKVRHQQAVTAVIQKGLIKAAVHVHGGVCMRVCECPQRGSLMPVQARLVAAAPLAGAWGTERFGFAEVPILAALEALPGADACAEYVFVEERGPWEAEARRLEKEVLAHSKHKQRVRGAGRV